MRVRLSVTFHVIVISLRYRRALFGLHAHAARTNGVSAFSGPMCVVASTVRLPPKRLSPTPPWNAAAWLLSPLQHPIVVFTQVSAPRYRSNSELTCVIVMIPVCLNGMPKLKMYECE